MIERLRRWREFQRLRKFARPFQSDHSPRLLPWFAITRSITRTRSSSSFTKRSMR